MEFFLLSFLMLLAFFSTVRPINRHCKNCGFFKVIVCLTIVATFRPHTAVLHKAIVSIYWVEPFVPPWLLMIGVSQTSLMIGGFRSKALLALWEDDTDPLAVRCGRGRQSCCLKSTVSLSSDQTIGKFVVLEFLLMNSYWISLAALSSQPLFLIIMLWCRGGLSYKPGGFLRSPRLTTSCIL